MNELNAWNTIPLGDYEQHMQHADVGQAQLLNRLTAQYLRQYPTQYLLFLGVSGGNGLEHIDVSTAKRVCGVDINSSYLQETHHRFGAAIPQLDLVKADINTQEQSFIQADFVWAGLIFEYVDPSNCLAFIRNNTGEAAKLIVTIQSNNGVASVSKTGIDSVKSVASIFHVVDRENLIATALCYGFEAVGVEENFLPNGKSLLTYTFSKSGAISRE
jgi:hypothetical protein